MPPPSYKGWTPPPPPQFLTIFLRFSLKWKAVDFLNKIWYVSWVVALLAACDVTIAAEILDFIKNWKSG